MPFRVITRLLSLREYAYIHTYNVYKYIISSRHNVCSDVIKKSFECVKVLPLLGNKPAWLFFYIDELNDCWTGYKLAIFFTSDESVANSLYYMIGLRKGEVLCHRRVRECEVGNGEMIMSEILAPGKLLGNFKMSFKGRK